MKYITKTILLGIICIYSCVDAFKYKGKDHKYYFEENSSLARAIEKNDLPKIKAIVKLNPKVLNSPGKDGMYLLHWAYLAQKLESFQLLLKLGADLKAKVPSGDSIMFLIAKPPKQNPENLEFLKAALIAGGNPDCIDAEIGWSALRIAAGDNASFERLRLLVDHGADINKRTLPFGHTAVMHAANLYQFKNAYYLLKKGANFRLKNFQGKSLIDIMKENVEDSGFQERDKYKNKILKFLRKKGVQI